MSCRQLDLNALRQLLNWRYLAFIQFCVFFFLNAALYTNWEGNRLHYKSLELESWSLTLLSVFILGIWLHRQNAKDIKRALIIWLPVGLSVSFTVASVWYFSGHQDARIRAFTPNALIPPFWFLIFTMASFVWLSEMSYLFKLWRFVLFLMAGVMVVYGGARLVLLAWILCGLTLAVWFYIQTAAKYRLLAFFQIGSTLAIIAGGMLLLDFFAGGIMTYRMTLLFNVDFTYEGISSQFLRIQIWSGALSIIADNPVIGIGKVNERLALQQELGWDRWLRAHQTYLSYLIAGGIPALISGLLMQSSSLAFLSPEKRSVFFPAFLGLGVVVTMNCFTDSIFQSGVSVQVFMLTTLLFLRASDEDHPTLAPQKQVSPAIT